MSASRQRIFLPFLFLLSFGFSMFFVIYSPHWEADSGRYDTLGWNLAKGHGFSPNPELPHEKEFLRTPVYPLFLAAIYTICGRHYFMVYLFQAILYGVLSVLLYFLAKETFNIRVGCLSSLIFSVHPLTAWYVPTIMAEVLFTLLFTSAIVVLLLAVRKNRTALFALSGILLGVATLCRPVTIYLPLLFLIVMLVVKSIRKQYWSKIIVLICMFYISMTPWMVRNYLVFDKFGMIVIENGVGWSLYSATKEYHDKDWEELIREGNTADSRTIMESYDYQAVQNAFNNYYLKAAENIKRDPTHYIKTIPIRFIRIWVPSYHTGFSSTTILLVRISGIIFIIAGLSGIILSMIKREKILWLIISIFYINAISSLLMTTSRYTIPIRGMLMIFIAYLVVWVVDGIKSRKNKIIQSVI